MNVCYLDVLPNNETSPGPRSAKKLLSERASAEIYAEVEEKKTPDVLQNDGADYSEDRQYSHARVLVNELRDSKNPPDEYRLQSNPAYGLTCSSSKVACTAAEEKEKLATFSSSRPLHEGIAQSPTASVTEKNRRWSSCLLLVVVMSIAAAGVSGFVLAKILSHDHSTSSTEQAFAAFSQKMDSMQSELNKTREKLSQLTKLQATQQTELNQTRGFIEQQRASTGFDFKEVGLAQNETGGRLEETSVRLNDTAVQVKMLEEKLRNVSNDLSAVKTACRGIAAWKIFPWINWSKAGIHHAPLIHASYPKTRSDTILHVEFHTMLVTHNAANDHHCNSWFIRFNGKDCTLPAPVITARYTSHPDGSTSWIGGPAEVGGFCSATSTGEIQPGDIDISVYVNETCGSGSTYTGLTNTGNRATTYLLVEEYCQ